MKNLKNITALSLVVVSIFIYSSCLRGVDYSLPDRLYPKADAGFDQTITASSTVTLKGKGYITNDDHKVNDHISEAQWFQLYDSTVEIKNKIETQGRGDTIFIETLVTGLTASTVPTEYYFRLLITDSRGDQADDMVTITVLPAAAANQSPVATITTPEPVSITLPVTEVTLTGTGTDPEGGGVLYLWTQLPGGPATSDIKTSTQAETLITGLTVPGTYMFVLAVTDTADAIGRDTITVIVNDAISDNTFKISSDVFAVSQTSTEMQPDHYFSVKASPNSSEQLWFYFYSDTSFPATNTTRLYQIGYANAGNKMRVKASHSPTHDNQYQFYNSIDTTGSVTTTVENRNGKIYLTMPETVAYHFNNQSVVDDTVHVSANVHE